MSTILTGSFTASEQTSPVRSMTVGTRLIVSFSGTWTGVVRVMVNGASLATITANTRAEYRITLPAQAYLHAAMVSTGTVEWRLEEANDAVTLGDYEWDDLRFPAQGINPPGLVSDPTIETDETKFPGTLLFSKTTSNMVSGIAQMSHTWAQGTAVRPHVHWSQVNAGAGNVLWHFYYRLSSRTGAPGAWVGPIVGVHEVMPNDLADKEAITGFGDINIGNTTSQIIAWRIYRIGGDAADTLDSLARLFEFDIHYQKDSLGSGGEFIK